MPWKRRVVVLLAFLPTLAAGEVRFTVSEVKDSRTTGTFFAGLELKLAVTGDEIQDARAMRVALTKAVDDAGRDLLKPDPQGSSFSGFGGSAATNLTLALKNPARKAEGVREIVGSVEFFVPDRDPAAVALVKGFAGTSGKPIAHAGLKAAHVEVTPLTKYDYEALRRRTEEQAKAKAAARGVEGAVMTAFGSLFGSFTRVGDDDVVLRVNDPDHRLVDIEVIDDVGKKVESRGHTRTDEMRVLHFDRPLPAGATLRLFVATPRAVVVAPLRLTAVALP